jgi:hypothetical protein
MLDKDSDGDYDNDMEIDEKADSSKEPAPKAPVKHTTDAHDDATSEARDRHERHVSKHKKGQ